MQNTEDAAVWITRKPEARLLLTAFWAPNSVSVAENACFKNGDCLWDWFSCARYWCCCKAETGLGAAKAKKGNINAIVATEPVIDDFSIDDLSLQMNNLRKDR